MGDPTSSYVFSIDPAVVNIGVCLYDYKNGEVLFADRIQIAPSLKALGPDSQIVPKVFKLFFDTGSPYAKMIKSAKMVVIENQMKARMKIIQHVIGAMCFAGNVEYTMLAPQSVKCHFGTGSRARAKKGNRVKGTVGNYKANKVMAIEKATELHPKLFSNCPKTKQDDIADALLMCVYWGDKITGKRAVAIADNPIIKKKRKKNV